MNDIKRYACHRLYWNVDSCQGQSVVSVNQKGEVCSFKLLDGEMGHTEWLGGIIILSPMEDLRLERELNGLLQNAFQIEIPGPLYAWHVSHFDFEKLDFTSQSKLRKL